MEISKLPLVPVQVAFRRPALHLRRVLVRALQEVIVRVGHVDEVADLPEAVGDFACLFGKAVQVVELAVQGEHLLDHRYHLLQRRRGVLDRHADVRGVHDHLLRRCTAAQEQGDGDAEQYDDVSFHSA